MPTNNPPLYLMVPDRDPTRPLEAPPATYPPGIEDADGVLIVEEGEHNQADAPPPDLLSLEGQLADLRRRLVLIRRLLENLPSTWGDLFRLLATIRTIAEEQ